MKVQKFTSSIPPKQVFKSHSKNEAFVSVNKTYFDMDSVDDALLTDSIDKPIIPQIVRKFQKAYNILFPTKVISKAENIKSQIDEYVEGKHFKAVA